MLKVVILVMLISSSINVAMDLVQNKSIINDMSVGKFSNPFDFAIDVQAKKELAFNALVNIYDISSHLVSEIKSMDTVLPKIPNPIPSSHRTAQGIFLIVNFLPSALATPWGGFTLPTKEIRADSRDVIQFTYQFFQKLGLILKGFDSSGLSKSELHTTRFYTLQSVENKVCQYEIPYKKYQEEYKGTSQIVLFHKDYWSTIYEVRQVGDIILPDVVKLNKKNYKYQSNEQVLNEWEALKTKYYNKVVASTEKKSQKKYLMA